MGSIRYLNTILTVIAVLMVLELWTQWAGGRSDEAYPTATLVQAAGIPNAGHQRQQIVNQLKQVSQHVEAVHNLFLSGKARVRLEALPDRQE